jgi:hypothetical protein
MRLTVLGAGVPLCATDESQVLVGRITSNFARVSSGVGDDELKSEARGMGPAALPVPFDG